MNEEIAAQIVAALDRLTVAIAILTIVVGTFLALVYLAGWTRAGKGAPGIPDPLKFDVKKGRDLYERGLNKQLIDYASSCISKYPNDIEARWILGLAYFYGEEFRSALEQFNEVVRLDPGWKENPGGPYLAEIEAQLSVGRPSGDRH